MQTLSGLAASSKDPKIKVYLQQLSGYSNIPRKEKKFINFAKNR